MKILIVDDEPAIVDLIKINLELKALIPAYAILVGVAAVVVRFIARFDIVRYNASRY